MADFLLPYLLNRCVFGSVGPEGRTSDMPGTLRRLNHRSKITAVKREEQT